MNQLAKKLTAVGVCAAFCLCGVTGIVYAKNTNNPQESQTSVQKAEPAKETQQNLSKDETVYVMAGADGTVQKIIVSDWIKNELKSSSISDQSELTNIENVKGEESYTVNRDHMTVWDAQGNDIYYQGNIEKELPVGLTISYQLDGKAISAQELAGKSGKVTIRFDYENRQYETVEIDGKKERIYVPFAMLTEMLLDNETFRNVEVSNGKLLNDGDHTVVAGLAFPGLQENLALSRDKIEFPDYVEITADVENFEMGMTVTIATNEIFSELDETKLDDADDATDSLNELTDAMTQLIDGSSALYDGLYTLLERSGELVSGVNQLADGAQELKEGADALDSGAGTLQDGLKDLASGLNTLSRNSADLNSGAEQVFRTLLSTATEQIQTAGISVPKLTIANYAKVLNGIIDSLDETAVYNQALQQVTAAVEAKRSVITQSVTTAVREQVTATVTQTVESQVTEQVTAAVREQVTGQVLKSVLNLTKTEYDAAVVAGSVTAEQQQAVESAIEQQMNSAQIQATIQEETAAKMASDTIQSTISDTVDAQMQSESMQATIAENVEKQVQQLISENMASDAIQAQLAAASEGAKSIISLKASLDSYNAFYLGLHSYTNGVDSAASGAVKLQNGADTLKDGSAALKAGAAKLYNGILELKDNMPALVDGITQLRDGSMELSDGLKQLNEEGIQKLVDLVDGDLNNLLTRLRATADVSKNYRNFAGISDEMDGQVKFIYRTEEIQAN